MGFLAASTGAPGAAAAGSVFGAAVPSPPPSIDWPDRGSTGAAEFWDVALHAETKIALTIKSETRFQFMMILPMPRQCEASAAEHERHSPIRRPHLVPLGRKLSVLTKPSSVRSQTWLPETADAQTAHVVLEESAAATMESSFRLGR